MTDAVWIQLEHFARDELGRPLWGREFEISPESRIEEDLKLTGVDAVEFIDKWAEKFNIKAPDGFPYARYFGAEGLDLVGSLLGVFSKRFRDAPLVPITLAMLAEAMRRGEWRTDEIELAVKDGYRN